MASAQGGARTVGVAYELDVDPDARDQIAALPADALTSLAEAMVMLELTPWNGAPLHKGNPGGAVRTLPFGRTGMITYLILDDLQRVDVLNIVWVGWPSRSATAKSSGWPSTGERHLKPGAGIARLGRTAAQRKQRGEVRFRRVLTTNSVKGGSVSSSVFTPSLPTCPSAHRPRRNRDPLRSR